jgi:polyisoprenoid-binding protein YceI
MNRHSTLAGLLAAAVLVTSASAQAAPVNYKLDLAHSEVGFTVRHLFSKVNGHFAKFSGTFVYDAANPSGSSAQVDIDPASIYTGVEARDKHLRGADFFDVEKFPKMGFVSKSVKALGKDQLELAGELTMHGATKPVTLVVNFLGSGTGPDGMSRAGFEATGKLNRQDYGVSFNKTLDKGGLMLGDDVDLRIDVEAAEVAAAAPAK